MSRIVRTKCMVTGCYSSTTSTPDKKFFTRTSNNHCLYEQWCKAIQIDREFYPVGCRLIVCEDHFNLQEDTSNYWQYTLMGTALRLKPEAIPSRFECRGDQNDVNVKTDPVDPLDCGSLETDNGLLTEIKTEEMELCGSESEVGTRMLRVVPQVGTAQFEELFLPTAPVQQPSMAQIVKQSLLMPVSTVVPPGETPSAPCLASQSSIQPHTSQSDPISGSLAQLPCSQSPLLTKGRPRILKPRTSIVPRVPFNIGGDIARPALQEPQTKGPVRHLNPQVVLPRLPLSTSTPQQQPLATRQGVPVNPTSEESDQPCKTNPILARFHQTSFAMKCFECPQVFANITFLKTHMVSHNSPKVKCFYCNEEFDRDKILSHFVETHKCQLCGKEYRSTLALQMHHKLEHTTALDLPGTINTVQQVNPTRPRPVMMRSLEDQLKRFHFSVVQKKPSTFRCDRCGLTLQNLFPCREHAARRCMQFSCYICHKVVPTKSLIMEHMRNQHLRRYRCSIKGCRRSYEFTEGLKLHQQLYHKFPMKKIRWKKNGLVKKKKKQKKVAIIPQLPKKSVSGRPLRRVVARALQQAQLERVLQGSQLACDVCQVVRHSRNAMRKHLWQRHLSYLNGMCAVCDYESPSWALHKKHLNRSIHCSLWNICPEWSDCD